MDQFIDDLNNPLFLLGTQMLANAGHMRNDPGFGGRMGNALGGWQQLMRQQKEQERKEQQYEEQLINQKLDRRLRERQIEASEKRLEAEERRHKLKERKDALAEKQAEELAELIEQRGLEAAGPEGTVPFPYLLGSHAAKTGDTGKAFNMMAALQPKPAKPTTMERNIQTLVGHGVPRDVAIKLESGAYKTTKDITGLPIVIDLIDNKPVGRVNMRGEWEPAPTVEEAPEVTTGASGLERIITKQNVLDAAEDRFKSTEQKAFADRLRGYLNK
jgi:hypothetical protein